MASRPATLALSLTLVASTPVAADDDTGRAEIAARIALADRAFADEQWSAAREHYALLLLRLPPPLRVTVHEQIARCYGHEGAYLQELEHLQLLLDRDPNNMPLRALMAAEALRGGLLERSRALLQSVDEAPINDPVVYFNVAALFVNRGQTEDAVRYFSKAIAVDPAYLDGYFQRGLAYFQLQRHAESQADLRRVLALAPADSAQARTALAALAAIR